MFFVFSKIFDVALLPLTWAIILILFAIPWRRPRRRQGWKRRRIFGALGLAVLWGFALEPVANGLIVHVESGASSSLRPDVTYDVVVLLGGIVDERVTAETGLPAYNDNVERLVATHRLLAEGRARSVIISSAALDPSLAELGEARVLGRQLEAWGIEPSRMVIEERARNTYENALYSKALAREHGFGSAVIVTSAFHMRRAAECFAAVDWPVDRYPVDFRGRRSLSFSDPAFSLLPRPSALAQSSAMLREMFGLWIYRLRGYAKRSG